MTTQAGSKIKSSNEDISYVKSSLKETELVLRPSADLTKVANSPRRYTVLYGSREKTEVEEPKSVGVNVRVYKGKAGDSVNSPDRQGWFVH